MSATRIDPRLESDSEFIGGLQICDIRLANDSRWPWLILVPRLPEAIELHDLDVEALEAITRETAEAAGALKSVTGCKKINSGSLGNVVQQLHIHVVARNEGDANWPGPIWGFGTSEPYNADSKDALVKQLKAQLF